jgi:hypothetical protein
MAKKYLYDENGKFKGEITDEKKTEIDPETWDTIVKLVKLFWPSLIAFAIYSNIDKQDGDAQLITIVLGALAQVAYFFFLYKKL